MNAEGSQKLNPWLLCRSRRHSGRTYFFNKLTGDAVWNLSPEILSLMKRRPNISEAILNTEYPEPNEAYDDSINQQVPAAMHNTFHGQSAIPNINFSHCIPQNTFNNITVGLPVLNVHQSSRNWNESSQQSQYYLTPQQYQGHAHSSTPIKSPGIRKNESFTLPMEKKVILHKQYDSNDEMYLQNNSSNLISDHGHAPHRGENEANVREEVVEDDLQETNNFNITALQTLFKIDIRTKVWFLVLDDNVFLENLNFIKEIRNADNRCRLVVPECVLNCIQKGTTSVNKMHMNRALKAAIFISNILTENRAIIDKENPYDDHIQNIVACFKRYSQKDFKVVLITENNIRHYTNDITCPIFRMEEIEYYLIHGVLKETKETLHLPITITIQNNSSRKSVSIQTKNKITESDPPIELNKSCIENQNISESSMEIDLDIERKKTTESQWNPWNRSKYSSTSSVSGSTGISSVTTSVDDSKHVDQNAMFEVTSEVMQENLANKSEEWVSRFTQIMEEALNQILQKAAFDTSPPPWTMYEACECIKRGFKNENDVVDAANKLGDVIFDNGALRGKINHNINPAMFMKIYSYGVYLIDALQGVFEDDENLQTAEKLLAKLLLDIETPDFNNSFNELEASMNVHNDQATQGTSSNKQRMTRITRSKSRHMFTSLTVQEQTENSKIKILQFLPGKDNFLSNFELKNVAESNDRRDIVNPKTDGPPKMEPKMIRNFTKISKLERRLDANISDDQSESDFILDGAEVPPERVYTQIDFIKQMKAKLSYVFKFCQDTRALLNLQNLDKKDVNSRAKKLANLVEFFRLQLKEIYERKKDVYLNILKFNEAEYNYYREFVKHCLDECSILNTALAIIITETNMK